MKVKLINHFGNMSIEIIPENNDERDLMRGFCANNADEASVKAKLYEYYYQKSKRLKIRKRVALSPQALEVSGYQNYHSKNIFRKVLSKQVNIMSCIIIHRSHNCWIVKYGEYVNKEDGWTSDPSFSVDLGCVNFMDELEALLSKRGNDIKSMITTKQV